MALDNSYISLQDMSNPKWQTFSRNFKTCFVKIKTSIFLLIKFLTSYKYVDFIALEYLFQTFF